MIRTVTCFCLSAQPEAATERPLFAPADPTRHPIPGGLSTGILATHMDHTPDFQPESKKTKQLLFKNAL